MAILQIFKSKVASVSYFFKNGKQAAFINGKFITDIEQEIEELMADIGAIGSDKSKHPHLYVDPNEKELDTEAPTYEEVIAAKAYAKAKADILAEQSRAMNPTANVSTSDSSNTAASFASTSTLNGLDGSTPVPVPVLTDVAKTSPTPVITGDLQAKLASLSSANPVASSATVGV